MATIFAIPAASIVWICFLLHVVADFNLQGMLGNLKQKSWWQQNYSDEMYKGDYKTAGWVHACSWAALTFLPFCTTRFYFWAVAVNAVIHYFIDDQKANKRTINLTVDQFMHFAQIVLTVTVANILYAQAAVL